MKLFKKFIVSVLASIMVVNVVQAKTENINEKLTNANLVEQNSSDINVNVIRYDGENETVIYSGALSGYSNGILADMDFSEIDYMVIFDWDTATTETLFIIPVDEQTITNMNSVVFSQNVQNSENSTSELQNTNQNISENIKTNMALMYNNKYYENVLLPGQTLSIPVTITNSGDSLSEIMSYIAVYDLNGRLTDVIQGNSITVLANQTLTTSLSKEFSADTACAAKVFLWQKDTLKPVADSIYLTIQNQDYYADTYTKANKIDIDKQLCGVINTSADIDIVKFTPTTTGLYALQIDASNGTVCGLYDSTQTLLNSVSAVTDKNYLLYSLTSNQDYYIRFNGAENYSYEITPTLPSEIITLTKNIGTASSLSENYDYNVYKFTPTTTGSYVITAVDSSNVKADLYNASFEKVASSDVSDTSVSFRITNDMTANQTYYIVVYPKSETSLGTYTMYVEEPFTLISVE